MTTTRTIKQKIITIEIEGGSTITVRRMSWRDARDFLRCLVDTLKGLSASGQLKQLMEAKTSDVPTSQLLEQLGPVIESVISGSIDLVTMIARAATNLSAEEFDKLDSLSAAAVVTAAIEINADEELKNSLAGIAGAVARLMPAPKTS